MYDIDTIYLSISTESSTATSVEKIPLRQIVYICIFKYIKKAGTYTYF